MNRRIGLLFSIVFFVLWLMHIISDIMRGMFIASIIEPFHIFCLVAFVLFLISSHYKNDLSKCTQIMLILASAIWTLYDGERGLFSGLSMFFVDILLAYSYGIYNKHTKLRLVLSVVVLYVIFVLSPTCDNQNRFINAFAWIGFISAMCFVVWFIFKDSIEKLKNTEAKSNEKYMRVLEEAISVARDAIELCEKEKQKLSE